MRTHLFWNQVFFNALINKKAHAHSWYWICLMHPHLTGRHAEHPVAASALLKNNNETAPCAFFFSPHHSYWQPEFCVQRRKLISFIFQISSIFNVETRSSKIKLRHTQIVSNFNLIIFLEITIDKIHVYLLYFDYKRK